MHSQFLADQMECFEVEKHTWSSLGGVHFNDSETEFLTSFCWNGGKVRVNLFSTLDPLIHFHIRMRHIPAETL